MIGVLIHLVQFENLLEEINNRLIVCMRLMILCKAKLKELMKILKEMLEFFVLQRKEIVMPTTRITKALHYKCLEVFRNGIQFFVLGSEFFVLALRLINLNSLYRASQAKFTHESFITGKLFNILLVTTYSCIVYRQKLHMSKTSCIENRTFLYISQLK